MSHTTQPNVMTYLLGDLLVDYIVREEGGVELRLCPAAAAPARVPRRATIADSFEMSRLPAAWRNQPGEKADSLVQLKIAGDDYGWNFSQGRTLRASASVGALRFLDQDKRDTPAAIEIITRLRDAGDRFICTHRLRWPRGTTWIELSVTLANTGSAHLGLELLASFSLGGLTPFAADDATGRLILHRLRSQWAQEGRLVSETLESLHLERTWQNICSGVERFGQVGTMPVRGWFPLLALEDTAAGVSWAAQLTEPGSWQLEVHRLGDAIALSGGLADREFGHWEKTLAPGESFTTRPAWLTCVQGGADAAFARLLPAHTHHLPAPLAPAESARESRLPVVFNEFCTSWGQPDEASVLATASLAASLGCEYYVIDAGWYAARGTDWGSAHGDWLPDPGRFPSGLPALATRLRALGLVPGLWFEPETLGPDSTLARNPDAPLLRRHAVPIVAGNRRFLDFRLPEVRARFHDRVTALLRDAGFGYLKIDYNDNIGTGPDGSAAPGEGLRQHLAGVESTWLELRRALPGLVIENCSSGGHRLCPPFTGLGDMHSFSDAHECPEIPAIAANLLRVCPARILQIWAVLRASDDTRRLRYSLAAAFLGRVCISGDLPLLSTDQLAFVRALLARYRQSTDLIRDGLTHRHGPALTSYRHPAGWQAVVFATPGSALLIAHTFAQAPATVQVPLDPTFAAATVEWSEADAAVEWSEADAAATVRLESGFLHWRPAGDFDAVIVRLQCD
jgi:alpha-galactosidase